MSGITKSARLLGLPAPTTRKDLLFSPMVKAMENWPGKRVLRSEKFVDEMVKLGAKKVEVESALFAVRKRLEGAVVPGISDSTMADWAGLFDEKGKLRPGMQVSREMAQKLADEANILNRYGVSGVQSNQFDVVPTSVAAERLKQGTLGPVAGGFDPERALRAPGYSDYTDIGKKFSFPPVLDQEPGAILAGKNYRELGLRSLMRSAGQGPDSLMASTNPHENDVFARYHIVKGDPARGIPHQIRVHNVQADLAQDLAAEENVIRLLKNRAIDLTSPDLADPSKTPSFLTKALGYNSEEIPALLTKPETVQQTLRWLDTFVEDPANFSTPEAQQQLKVLRQQVDEYDAVKNSDALPQWIRSALPPLRGALDIQSGVAAEAGQQIASRAGNRVRDKTPLSPKGTSEFRRFLLQEISSPGSVMNMAGPYHNVLGRPGRSVNIPQLLDTDPVQRDGNMWNMAVRQLLAEAARLQGQLGGSVEISLPSGHLVQATDGMSHADEGAKAARQIYENELPNRLIAALREANPVSNAVIEDSSRGRFLQQERGDRTQVLPHNLNETTQSIKQAGPRGEQLEFEGGLAALPNQTAPAAGLPQYDAEMRKFVRERAVSIEFLLGDIGRHANKLTGYGSRRLPLQERERLKLRLFSAVEDVNANYHLLQQAMRSPFFDSQKMLPDELKSIAVAAQHAEQSGVLDPKAQFMWQHQLPDSPKLLTVDQQRGLGQFVGVNAPDDLSQLDLAVAGGNAKLPRAFAAVMNQSTGETLPRAQAIQRGLMPTPPEVAWDAEREARRSYSASMPQPESSPWLWEARLEPDGTIRPMVPQGSAVSGLEYSPEFMSQMLELYDKGHSWAAKNAPYREKLKSLVRDFYYGQRQFSDMPDMRRVVDTNTLASDMPVMGATNNRRIDRPGTLLQLDPDTLDKIRRYGISALTVGGVSVLGGLGGQSPVQAAEGEPLIDYLKRVQPQLPSGGEPPPPAPSPEDVELEAAAAQAGMIPGMPQARFGGLLKGAYSGMRQAFPDVVPEFRSDFSPDQWEEWRATRDSDPDYQEWAKDAEDAYVNQLLIINPETKEKMSVAEFMENVAENSGMNDEQAVQFVNDGLEAVLGGSQRDNPDIRRALNDALKMVRTSAVGDSAPVGGVSEATADQWQKDYEADPQNMPHPDSRLSEAGVEKNRIQAGYDTLSLLAGNLPDHKPATSGIMSYISGKIGAIANPADENADSMMSLRGGGIADRFKEANYWASRATAFGNEPENRVPDAPPPPRASTLRKDIFGRPIAGLRDSQGAMLPGESYTTVEGLTNLFTDRGNAYTRNIDGPTNTVKYQYDLMKDNPGYREAFDTMSADILRAEPRIPEGMSAEEAEALRVKLRDMDIQSRQFANMSYPLLADNINKATGMNMLRTSHLSPMAEALIELPREIADIPTLATAGAGVLLRGPAAIARFINRTRAASASPSVLQGLGKSYAQLNKKILSPVAKNVAGTVTREAPTELPAAAAIMAGEAPTSMVKPDEVTWLFSPQKTSMVLDEQGQSVDPEKDIDAYRAAYDRMLQQRKDAGAELMNTYRRYWKIRPQENGF